MPYDPTLVAEPSTYADHPQLHEILKDLRQNNPIARGEREDMQPFWVLTRHADIREVESKPEIFHNAPWPILVKQSQIEANVRNFGQERLLNTLLHMDAPEHTKMRAVTSQWFNPGSVNKLKENFREIAKHHIDQMAAKGGSCDFAKDIALWYPLRIIMNILGVPEKDEPLMLALTQQATGAFDPDFTPDADEGNFAKVVLEFIQYFAQLTQDRKENPRDDLATLLAHTEVDGEPLSDQDRLSYYIIIAIAGHDTTSSSLAGAMLLLAQKPELLAQLKADPSLIPNALEEIIRWTHPVPMFMRTATEDYVLRDVKISKGDWLLLSFPSACRDEEAIEDPFDFRIDRKPNRHLAFGHGPHMCLGQHLARLELVVFLEELVKRLTSVEVTGPYEWMQSTVVSGLKTLPIRFTLADAPS